MYKGRITANVPEADEGKGNCEEIVEVAENFKDMEKVAGSEQEAVNLFNQMYKIQVQNKLRRAKRVELGLIESKGTGAKSKGIERVD